MKRSAQFHKRIASEALEARQLFATIFVDAASPGPSHDGVSWGTAYTDLQAALVAAVAGTEIHVAQGTYRPTAGTDRSVSFQLKDGVNIYGGYAGQALANPDARDTALYPTILSGDIGVVGSSADNSFHVVSTEGLASPIVLDGVTITGGNASATIGNDSQGGGVYLTGGLPYVFNDCIFISNSAYWCGGGIYGGGAAVFSNCAFRANTVYGTGGVGFGGAFYSVGISPQLINCVFEANSAVRGGAAIYNTGGSSTLINCTINTNYLSPAYQSGAAILSNFTGSVTVKNSIVWNCGNSPVTGDTPISITYSDIQGGFTGTGNTNVDPKFARSPWTGPDGAWGTADDVYGDYRLRTSSPLLDIGSNAAVPAGTTTDRAGNPRIQNGTVDVGAYEGPVTVSPKTIYVDSQATGPKTGTSWANAITELQPAIAAAIDGDTIRLAQGVYTPTPTTDRQVSVVLREGVALYGGYAGSASANPDSRNITSYLTQLSGGIGNPADNSDNSFHVIYARNLSAASVLDGVTITAGNASGTSADGGGIYLSSASPTVSNCTLSANSASGRGAGVFAGSGASPSFINTTFSGNTAADDGGALFTDSASVAILNGCSVLNSKALAGAGIYADGAAQLSNSSFTGNQILGNTSGRGGAVYSGSQLTATNCVFTSNTAGTGQSGSGGAVSLNSNCTFVNCTFTSNTAYAGGAIGGSSSQNSTISNCVFTGNSATDGGAAAIGGATITASTFTRNTTTDGGGALYLAGGNPVKLSGCGFFGNLATGTGGAIYSLATTTMTNCAFSGNVVSSKFGIAGAVYFNVSGDTISNCTFTKNSVSGASGNGGAIYSLAGTWAVNNSIFWGNSATSNSQYRSASGAASPTYCDIQGGFNTSGNISTDPLFVRTPTTGGDFTWGTADDDYGDLRTQIGSPCIDAGNNAAVPSGTTTDLAGNARIADVPTIRDPGAIVDMGAYEYILPLTVSSASYVTDSTKPSLKLNFNGDVLASTLTVGDLSLVNQTTGTTVNVSAAAALTYDASLRAGTWLFAPALVDGNYQGSLSAGSATDPLGNGLSAYTVSFFSLAGDANHDRYINTFDFTALAQNFNKSSAVFSQGDFNYDGKVNALDFNLLATKFGTYLAPPTGPAMNVSAQVLATPTPSLFADRPVTPFDEIL